MGQRWESQDKEERVNEEEPGQGGTLEEGRNTSGTKEGRGQIGRERIPPRTRHPPIALPPFPQGRKLKIGPVVKGRQNENSCLQRRQREGGERSRDEESPHGVSASVESDSRWLHAQDRAAIPRLLQPACAAEGCLRTQQGLQEDRGTISQPHAVPKQLPAAGVSPGSVATPRHK